MADTLSHRGPDDHGVWLDSEVGIALGHRRLSIVDLTAGGHQPMLSANGRFVISFNGEIYNFRKLREELTAAGHSFRSSSDTEVLLAAIVEWGLESAIESSVGMFAFALWDRERKSLSLVRDRMGEKPLYYGRIGSSLVFASELKALKAHSGWTGEVDREALTLFMRSGCVPAPYSIYRGIKKLPAGSLLEISDPLESGLPAPRTYWSLGDVAREGRGSLITSAQAATNELESRLRDAVAHQMIADVPLGAFLSGGIDSSTVVAVMQSQSSVPIKTFTIGFREGAFDETTPARAVAEHLGTDHTSLYVTARQATAVIPRLAGIYDEPFADNSQIPTFLLTSLARQDVTVALSGDGGDELFGGYGRYVLGPKLARCVAWMPPPLRDVLARGMTGLSQLSESSGGRQLARLTDGRLSYSSERVRKLAEILHSRGPERIYTSLFAGWQWPLEVVVDGSEPPLLDRLTTPAASFNSLVEWMLYVDESTYLSDDLLTKLDRAAMAVGLETRTPFLDHRVVELAWRLPETFKIRDGQGKWILRQVLYRYVPRELIERPKMGFMVPVADWLRGPLRSWAEELLDVEKMDAEGYLRSDVIQRKWREHLSGRFDWHYELWFVLMFQAWLREEPRSSYVRAA